MESSPSVAAARGDKNGEEENGSNSMRTAESMLRLQGDAAITWSGACGSLGKFCHKATASLAITFAVVICYAVLSLVSSYRLFSRYDAPIGYTNKGIDMSAVFRT
ncbi:hypothetical protein POM88_052228 [Heracleum sosnowskyi]|uniref:CASP-like protein n=1 Tax=Heracleum sosnowskyi TaxID=360622 RepID=A0AAD8GTP6_9APIA|nr:hypothetical protein POM88_052228 [Heracleum sosnowskyi]